MLHIIKSIHAIESALQYSQAGDQFLLLEDAVYGLIQPKLIQECLKDHRDQCWALKPDLEARGLNQSFLSSSQLVDFSGFVALTEQNTHSMTWD